MEANFASDDNSALYLLNDANRLFLFKRPHILFGRDDLPAYIDCTSDIAIFLQYRKV
jgi:hypothetical protein